MSTRVVNVKRERCEVYVGRATRALGDLPATPDSTWGNPFRLGIDGTRAECIAAYEPYIRERLATEPGLWDELLALDGKVLGCWCAPLACHADILVKLIEERKERRVPLAEAEPNAAELVSRLRPYCERIVVAGSIRRRKPTVKDIELVAVPRVDSIATDLFGQTTATHDQLHEHLRALREQGVVTDRLDKNGRPAFGARTKRLVYRGMGLDVFAVLPPAQWGVDLAIRTGSAEFSQRFMTAKRIGGNLPDHMIVRHACLYRDPSGRPLPVDREERAKVRVEDLEFIPTTEERDFFEAISLEWIEPEERA